MDAGHDLEGEAVPGQVGLTQAQIDADVDVDVDLVQVDYQVVARQKGESFAQVWSMALWMEGYDTNVVRRMSSYLHQNSPAHLPRRTINLLPILFTSRSTRSSPVLLSRNV
jgi:hypothetical protein